MQIDETKSALDNVWALINEANGTSLTPASGFSVGVPAVNAGAEPRNTKLAITAEESSGYQGTVDVFYNRRGFLDNVYPEPTQYVVPDRATTKEEIFTALVAMLKLVGSDVVIVENVVADMTTITLRPIANSLLYTGDTPFTLSWPSGMMTVDQLLANDDLPGFVLPLVNVPALLNVTDLPGFEKVQKSSYLWVTTIGPYQSNTEDASFSLVNGKLWYCDSRKVYAFDPIEGTELYQLDLGTRFGESGNMGYAIRGVDGNGVLWVAEEGYYNISRPTIVRIDTGLMIVKDELLGGQERVDGRSYASLTVNGATDFAWAYQSYIQSGVGTSYFLSRIDITTGARTDFGSIPIASGGMTYDPVNKIIWLGYQQSFVPKANLYQLDGSNNPVLLTTVTFMNSAVGVMAYLGNTVGGREMILVDQDVDNDRKLYLRRYDAATGNLIADLPINNPLGSSSIGPNGAVKYRPDTDEVYTTIYTATGAELWAFKRLDATQSRLVAGMNGADAVWDYALDTAGNRTFVFYEDDDNVANYFTQMRQP